VGGCDMVGSFFLEKILFMLLPRGLVSSIKILP